MRRIPSSRVAVHELKTSLLTPQKLEIERADSFFPPNLRRLTQEACRDEIMSTGEWR
jgi:hypothetical protein